MTFEESHQDVWHAWFAWYPIRLKLCGAAAPAPTVWLENIERRWASEFGLDAGWDYRKLSG